MSKDSSNSSESKRPSSGLTLSSIFGRKLRPQPLLGKNEQIKSPNPSAEKKLKGWGPLAAVVWAIIIYLVPQIVVGSLLTIYPELKHWNTVRATAWLNNAFSAEFVYTIFVEAIAIYMVWTLLKHYKSNFAAIGYKRAKYKDLLYIAIGFGSYIVLYLVVVNSLTKLLPGFNVNQQQNVGFQSAATIGPLVMAFISLVVLPPLVEEALFRGFVFSGLRRKFNFIGTAIGTSILFATPHLFEGTGGGLLWVAGVDTFILSLVLCYLREKTGRLWAGIGVHALKNSLAFASLFIFHAH